MAEIELFDGNRGFYVNSPDCCPHCQKGIVPIVIGRADSSFTFRSNGDTVFKKCVLIYECPSCHELFFGIYNWYYRSGNKIEIDRIVGGSPATYEFSKFIKDLSPKFVETYHQSEKAEFYECKEICGIGYRKSLEFLIKDFAIFKFPDEEANIVNPNFSLSNCIDKYIDDEDVKDLCKKSAWIGNDFAHYTSKHEDFDLEDLKTLINLCVGEIENYIKKINYRKRIEKK